ncbi:MAG: DUF106 domain-containing protein [Haloarculaceae archaeon]
MVRTDRKVDELAQEGQEMLDALQVVLDTAEQKGSVQWSDVSDDLTSGQWGRLIEKELLVDGHGNGFVIDDPEGLREALGEAEATPSEGDDESSWTLWDKIAAAAALAMFPAYSISSLRNVIGGVVDVFLGPLNDALPFYLVILILATITGTYSTLLRSELMDADRIGAYQNRMEEIRERRKEAKERGDDEALDRIQDEQMDAMGDQLGMFKEQFRPMGWIMVLTIPIFLWMYWQILQVHVGDATSGPVMTMPLVGDITHWNTGVLGPIQAWIVWYFICSMVMTQLLQKALDIDMTPS